MGGVVPSRVMVPVMSEVTVTGKLNDLPSSSTSSCADPSEAPANTPERDPDRPEPLTASSEDELQEADPTSGIGSPAASRTSSRTSRFLPTLRLKEEGTVLTDAISGLSCTARLEVPVPMLTLCWASPTSRNPEGSEKVTV